MTASLPLSVPAMFVIGLMGAGHCIGMCGGISSALGLAVSGNHKWSILGGYHLGRVASYSLAGVLIGMLGLWGHAYLQLGPALRILAGVLLILMGCYLADWWRALITLEKAGAHLWRQIQPIGNRLLPVHSFQQAILLGMVWGWLPCGLVYSALAYSATVGNPAESGLMMLAFGLGTTPAVLAGTVFSTHIASCLQNKRFRQLTGIILMGFGLWTVWGASSHFHDNQLDSPNQSVHQH